MTSGMRGRYGWVAAAWMAWMVVGCAVSLQPVSEDGGARADGSGHVDTIVTSNPDVAVDTGAREATVVDVPPRDVPAPDVVRDVPVVSDAPVPLPGGCNVDADCGGAMGSVCLTAWPGGLCTKQCSTDRACGANGICFQNICLPRCTPTVHNADGTVATFGGGECTGRDELCRGLDALDPTRGACFPSCAIPMDPGVLPCPTGTSCSLDLGVCTDPASQTVGTDPVGAPCTVGADGSNSTCRSGLCLRDSTPGPLGSSAMPSGLLGGYCTSIAIQLGLETYIQDQDIPRGNCPPGSVMLPADPATTPEGDPAYCFRECHADADCRRGYECFGYPQPDAGNFFTDGACLPIDCGHGRYAGVANGGCPPTDMCAISGDHGVCIGP